MQGKRLVLTAFSVAAMSLMQPALANMMSVPMGWFLEANGGSAHLSNTNFQGSTSSSGIGGNANLGYKFMPYVAGEVGYSRYPNTNIKTFSNGTTAGEIKHYSYGLSVRGILPISDSGFEVFAKLGVQRMKATISIQNAAAAASIGLGSSSHSSTGLYLGAGAQFYFMPEMAVVAQWQRAQGSSGTGTEDLYSLGLSFIFN
jgi:opacity protein-like surface antigen